MFKMLSIGALASLAFLLSPAMAAVEKRDTITIGAISGSLQCPAGWAFYNRINTAYCCPGMVENNGDALDLDNTYCCVQAPLEPSFSSCLPSCTEGGSPSATGLQCSTTVMLTDADYNSKVSAAATSVGFTNVAVSSETSTGGGAMMTSGPMAGAMMVAGGLLMAL